MNKPNGKKENIVVQELDGEVLIYDLENNKAFCLNETSSLVWQLCDGNHSVSEISDKVGKKLNAKSNEDLVWLALDQLKKEKLIANGDELVSKFDGMSRREVIKKIGVGSMIAFPVISSLIAPTPVHAQSAVCVAANCTCTSSAPGAGMQCTPTAGTTCAVGCRCIQANNGNTMGNCTV